MDFAKLTGLERLARLEAALHEQGFDLLRAMITSTAGAREEAQKRGSRAPATARAAGGRSSARASRGRS